MYLKVNWFFAMEHHFELSFTLFSLKNVIIRAREHHGKSKVLKVPGVVPQGPDQQKGVTSLPDSLLPVSPLHYREACPSLETHLKNSVTPYWCLISSHAMYMYCDKAVFDVSTAILV